jgi:hypothetical protein
MDDGVRAFIWLGYSLVAALALGAVALVVTVVL